MSDVAATAAAGPPEGTLTSSHMLSPYILEAPDPAERFVHFVQLTGILFVAAGVLGLLVFMLPGGSNFASAYGIGVLGLVGVVVGLSILALASFLNPLHVYAFIIAAALLTTVAVHFSAVVGMGYAAMLYAWVTTLSFSAFKKRWIFPVVAIIGVGYGIVLAYNVEPALAVNHWVFTLGTIVVTGVVVTLLVQSVHELARSEGSARAEAERAKEELFVLNSDLEDRVRTKVLEVERLSELRRLVSSHVADALLESDRALSPHRREIAVLFIDLRGFTRFAADCAPEEVIQVLEDFYRVLGRSFKKFEATVGAFEADGVMAYFNDPLPIEDPAERAVEMALGLQEPLGKLVQRWHDRGFELHYGIGIALGFATLGMVGFDGRQDYTAIGTVVNLASRLCGEAKEGEILIDRRAQLAIPRTIGVAPLEPMRLRGFREPVPVFRLIGAQVPSEPR